MKTQDAVRHFGTQAKLAKALGINPSAITQWGDEIPQRRQYEIERLTGGRLKAAPTEASGELPPGRQQGEGMQVGDTTTEVPEDMLSRATQLSALVAQLTLLIDDIERISNAAAAASVRAQYHQAMADLLACTHNLERPADLRTEGLRQRHVERAVEYQRELDRIGRPD